MYLKSSQNEYNLYNILNSERRKNIKIFLVVWGFDDKCIMYIVDRIEENIAVCENDDGTMVNIPIGNIKGNIREGIIIVKKGEYFFVDENKSRDRQKDIDNLTKGMWSYE